MCGIACMRSMIQLRLVMCNTSGRWFDNLSATINCHDFFLHTDQLSVGCIAGQPKIHHFAINDQ